MARDDGAVGPVPRRGSPAARGRSGREVALARLRPLSEVVASWGKGVALVEGGARVAPVGRDLGAEWLAVLPATGALPRPADREGTLVGARVDPHEGWDRGEAGWIALGGEEGLAFVAVAGMVLALEREGDGTRWVRPYKRLVVADATATFGSLVEACGDRYLPCGAESRPPLRATGGIDGMRRLLSDVVEASGSADAVVTVTPRLGVGASSPASFRMEGSTLGAGDLRIVGRIVEAFDPAGEAWAPAPGSPVVLASSYVASHRRIVVRPRVDRGPSTLVAAARTRRRRDARDRLSSWLAATGEAALAAIVTAGGETASA